MESNLQQISSLFDHQDWSKNRFALFYAILILLGVCLYAFILIKAGVYESPSLRILNVFIILVGFVALMWDYKLSKMQKLTYQNAFLLCARTGLYFCLLFLPLLLVFLSNDQSALNMVKTNETFGSSISVVEMTFWLYVETVGTTLTAGLLASYVARFGK